MRLILVGRPDQRARLRAELDATRVEIAGEFATMAEARASGIHADGVLMAEAGRVGAREEGWIEEPLTPREIQVLELLADGLSNKGIGARLGISDQTVKFHVTAITGKLGASNRTDAVRRALRRGLINL
jgi:DNA-binding NarL/FixJ family response regulator